MQIRPYNTYNTYNTNNTKANKRQNFGWLSLCQGNIVKTMSNGKKRLIPVEICLLRREDIAFIEEIFAKWKNTAYGGELLEHFLSIADLPHKFNKNKKSLYYLMLRPLTHNNKSPMCFAEIERDKDVLELTYIQTKQSIVKDKKKTISGCGQMMMYGIAMIAKALKSSSLVVYSSNHGFYQKVFTKSAPNEDFRFDILKSQLEEMIEQTRLKFGLTQTQEDIPRDVISEFSASSYLTEDRCRVVQEQMARKADTIESFLL